MQNGKSDKWFERIILVFSYFFLFILYSIDLYVVFFSKIYPQGSRKGEIA